MLFMAALNSKGTGLFVSWMKNAGYIYTMGSPTSAITQIGDLAFSLAKNGYYNTGVSLSKALLNKSMLKKEDLGIANVAQEFEDSSRAGDAVRLTFKLVGIEYVDNIGKQTYIESSYRRLVSQAKANKPALKKSLTEIFGADAEQVRKDLVAGNVTDNVKFLLFSELSDVQPVSLAEMPVAYLRGGNLRSLYMLKTYTIKQIDIYRREIFDKMAHPVKNPKAAAEGLQMLTRLSIALMLTGMGADELKNLLLGREIDLNTLVMDNLLKLGAISKYQIYQAKQDGVANTVMQTFFVPSALIAPMDTLIRDIEKINADKITWNESETVGHIPLVGKLYYWWEGGGVKKKEKEKAKNGGYKV